jgi:hypothetical protein
MILLAILAIWLVLITFAVVLCRIAAASDERHDDVTQRYPTLSAKRLRGDLPRLRVRWEERSAPAAQQERVGSVGGGSVSARDRDDRGRAGRYAA